MPLEVLLEGEKGLSHHAVLRNNGGKVCRVAVSLPVDQKADGVFYVVGEENLGGIHFRLRATPVCDCKTVSRLSLEVITGGIVRRGGICDFADGKVFWSDILERGVAKSVEYRYIGRYWPQCSQEFIVQNVR